MTPEVEPYWTPIQYRGFWDVPRIFLVRHSARLFLFDCPFDEAVEDYPDEYTVYELPFDADADLPKDWTELPARAVARLSEVPVSAVRFDPTRRQAIDAAVLERYFPPARAANGTAHAPDLPRTHPAGARP